MGVFKEKAANVFRTLCAENWSPLMGGIIIAFFVILLEAWYRPWGIVGGLRNWGDWVFYLLGLYEDQPPHPLWFSSSVLNIGFLWGAFLSATLAREFSFRVPPGIEFVKAIVSGILMGIGASLAMGCNIGGMYMAINNLAAVPSVVFGLLGLAVFLGTFGLPRSAPLVGGMVLSLMTLPTIIVATRAALKAVPPSIREAGYGVGASKHQVMLHHVLPLAMPGILTGTIIGLAQALGETAPLLLIGMNAFIPSIENMGILQPATALPTQIFSWADSPERGFVSRTSAAILILLAFLITAADTGEKSMAASTWQ